MENTKNITKGIITTIIVAGSTTVQAQEDSQLPTSEQTEKIELATDIVEAGLQSGIMMVGNDGTLKIEKSLFQTLKDRGILQNSKMDMSSDTEGIGGRPRTKK